MHSYYLQNNSIEVLFPRASPIGVGNKIVGRDDE